MRDSGGKPPFLTRQICPGDHSKLEQANLPDLTICDRIETNLAAELSNSLTFFSDQNIVR
jgi:hypothetical protein